MSLFCVIPELKIGSVIEVSGTSIRVELDGKITELTRVYQGVVYPIGQFGSMIKIHYGRTVLLAYVRLLRMRSELEREQGRPVPSAVEDSRIIDADLFGELVWFEDQSKIDFVRGVKTFPLPGQGVYIVTKQELKHIYEGAQSSQLTKTDKEEQPTPMLPIGSYSGLSGTTCYADADKLFGQHCAVLGSTGCGKSATVAAILHALLEHHPYPSKPELLRPRVVVIDPHGEYASAFGDRCVVYRAYSSPEEDKPDGSQEASRVLRLPYWIMSAEEFREAVVGKSRYEATAENNIVYKALIHARLAQRGWIEKSRDWKGQPVGTEDPEAPRATDPKYRQTIASYDRDTPDPFSLQEFVNHIEKEQMMRPKNREWQPLSETDSKPYSSVLDKLSVLRSDPRLTFMMADYRDGDPDLPAIISQFVGKIGEKDSCDIRIVDLSGLPNEIAGPLTAAIARLLFQYKTWQTREERERDPVLLICEEAHRYVPNQGQAEYASAQTAVRRIAKEGRKYGIGLMLVSQRPSDVERTVLSQCNSWLVMRLTNAEDQDFVTRFLPDSLAGLARVLSSLSRQEALFVGEAASIPARISIRTLRQEQLPGSRDISFVGGWVQPPIGNTEVAAVTTRWRNKGNAMP